MQKYNLTIIDRVFRFKPTQYWLNELQMLLGIENNPNFDIQNPNLLKAFLYLKDENLLLLLPSNKEILLAKLMSIISLPKENFEEKLEKIIDDLELPMYTDTLLYQILVEQFNLKPDLNLFNDSVQSFQVLLKIKKLLMLDLTTKYAYQGYQSQGYSSHIWQQWVNLFPSHVRDNLKHVMILNEQSQVCDIDWTKLIYFIFADFVFRKIIEVDEVYYLFVHAYLFHQTCPKVEKRFPKIEPAIMKFLYANVEELNAALILTDNFEQLVEILTNYLSALETKPFFEYLSLILESGILEKYPNLLEILDKKFQITHKLFAHAPFEQACIVDLVESNTHPFSNLLHFLDVCSGEQVFSLLRSRTPNFEVFFVKLLFMFPKQHALLLAQCKKLNAEQFFSLASEVTGDVGNLFQLECGLSNDNFQCLAKLINEKLMPHQIGLLLQNTNRLDQNALHIVCRRYPQHLQTFLEWLSQQEPELQFIILKQTDNIEDLDVLKVIVRHHPESLELFLGYFAKLPEGFQKTLLSMVAPKNQNIFHMCDALNETQFSLLLQTIREVDPTLVSNLFLMPDEKMNVALMTMLSNQNLLDLISTEIERLTPQEQLNLFAHNNSDKQSFISILGNYSMLHFSKWFVLLLSIPNQKVADNLIVCLNLPKFRNNINNRIYIIAKYITTPNISKVHLNKLLDVLSQQLNNVFINIVYQTFWELYTSPRYNEFKQRLNAFLDVYIRKTASKNTLSQNINVITFNMTKFIDSLPFLTQLTRSVLHSQPEAWISLAQCLINYPDTLNAILCSRLDDGLNMLHYALLISIKMANFNRLVETYVAQNKLKEALEHTDANAQTLLQYIMICKSSYLGNLIDKINQLPIDDQLVLMTGEKNILIFSIQYALMAFNQLSKLTPEILEICLSDPVVWKKAIEKKLGAFEAIVSILETLEPNKVQAILELQDETVKALICEKLSLSSIPQNPVNQALHSLFTSQSLQPETKKANTSQL